MATTQEGAIGAREQAVAEWNDLVHTGPGTLAGRWMRMFWHPVYRAVDLAPGQAKPIRIMSEDYTLFRGESGAVNLLGFRCAHRGTQLSTGWVEGENLRCFYHGWMYDGTGQCVEQPAERQPFAEKVKINSYPVQEYLGMIFAYLGEGEPPPLMRYAEFEDRERGSLDTPIMSVTPCNYFNIIDNDPIHIYFVHRTFNQAQGRADIPHVQAEETDYGYDTYAEDSVSRWLYRCYIPNMVHGRRDGSPNGEAIQWRVPIDDEHCLNIGVNLYYAGEDLSGVAARRARATPDARIRVNEVGGAILRGELHIGDVDDRAILFNTQDYVAQVGCGPIVDIEAQHLGPEDATSITLRRIFKRELKALAEDKPLKRWTRPSTPLSLHDDW